MLALNSRRQPLQFYTLAVKLDVNYSKPTGPGIRLRDRLFLASGFVTFDFLPQAFILYSTTTQSLPLLPNTSGEYISSALAGGTTNVPGVVARAM